MTDTYDKEGAPSRWGAAELFTDGIGKILTNDKIRTLSHSYTKVDSREVKNVRR